MDSRKLENRRKTVAHCLNFDNDDHNDGDNNEDNNKFEFYFDNDDDNDEIETDKSKHKKKVETQKKKRRNDDHHDHDDAKRDIDNYKKHAQSIQRTMKRPEMTFNRVVDTLDTLDTSSSKESSVVDAMFCITGENGLRLFQKFLQQQENKHKSNNLFEENQRNHVSPVAQDWDDFEFLTTPDAPRKKSYLRSLSK